MKIGIIGRSKDTGNYERFLATHKTPYITTLAVGEYSSCDGLIFPGGGDITPAFFGEHNTGSRNIDTELDILQLQAFDYGYEKGLPILGICKGMQIINVGLGGTIVQDMPTSEYHRYIEKDQYHMTLIDPSSFLYKLFGPDAVVNSAHHQSVNKLGTDLVPIQWCPYDNCIESFYHSELPIIGVQWHPERLKPEETSIRGSLLLEYFFSLFSSK